MEKYAATRPMGPGALPRNGLVEVRNEYGDFGYAVYDRVLLNEELEEYELRPIDDIEIQTGKRRAYTVDAVKEGKHWQFGPIEEFRTDVLPPKMKEGKENIRLFSFRREELEMYKEKYGN